MLTNQRQCLAPRESLALAPGEFIDGLVDPGHKDPVTKNVHGLLEGLQVLHAQDDGSGTPVLGDDDAAMLLLQALDYLGEAVLDIGQGHLISHRQSYKYS